MSRQEKSQRTASGRPRLRSVDRARDLETAHAELRLAIDTAYAERAGAWPAQVAAAIRAVLEFAAGEPGAAHVLVLDSLAQGGGDPSHQRHPVDHLARLLAAGRKENPEGETLPGLLEDALAGGIFMLIAQRLEAGDVEALPALAPDAIEFALTPYVGQDRARDVAAAKS